MRFAKRLSVVLGSALAAAALTIAGAPAASAAPGGPTLTSAPVSVYQIPAIGVQISGLVVPGPLLLSVNAWSPSPGHTAFSAPASRETCSSSAAGSLVRINYVNVGTGISGTATVKPCPYFLDPAPTYKSVYTGSGPIVITVAIVGSWAYPNAGQPSLPGVGGFLAP